MIRLLRYLSSIDDILTLQGCQFGGYCEVVLRDRKVILGGSIANLSSYLDDRFIRISRTVMVNKKHILKFDKQTVSLTNGQSLKISRRKQKDILILLENGCFV
jgi:DNA-binding LytR/AlgR family response regulator